MYFLCEKANDVDDEIEWIYLIENVKEKMELQRIYMYGSSRDNFQAMSR